MAQALASFVCRETTTGRSLHRTFMLAGQRRSRPIIWLALAVMILTLSYVVFSRKPQGPISNPPMHQPK